MISSKDFFMQLREGEEYCNCFMTKDVYSGIDHELREHIVVNSIRQKNSSFEGDEVHKELLRNVTKAKKELTKYEFEANNG